MERAFTSTRVAAFLVDFVGALVVGSIAIEITEGIGAVAEVIGVCVAIVMGGYVFLFKDVIDGAGFGKRVFDIAVRNNDDVRKTPSISQLMVRTFFLTLYPIEFIIMLVRPDKRRWGDLLANTRVVKTSVIRRCAVCSEYGYDSLSVDSADSPSEVKSNFNAMELDNEGACRKCRVMTHNNAMESDVMCDKSKCCLIL